MKVSRRKSASPKPTLSFQLLKLKAALGEQSAFQPDGSYFVFLHSTWESALLGLPNSVKAIYSDKLPPFAAA